MTYQYRLFVRVGALEVCNFFRTPEDQQSHDICGEWRDDPIQVREDAEPYQYHFGDQRMIMRSDGIVGWLHSF